MPAPPDSGAASARVGLSAVIISVDETTPRLLAVEAPGGREALPSTHLDDRKDRTLEQGVRRLVSSEIGVPVRYFEQLYTFGNRGRAPGGREVAVAYLALVRYQSVHGPRNPSWRSCYELFPWEDWRYGRPQMLDETIIPALEEWLSSAAPDEVPTRRERAEVTFGFGHARWDPVRVLDRYELAYELEARRKRPWYRQATPAGGPALGLPPGAGPSPHCRGGAGASPGEAGLQAGRVRGAPRDVYAFTAAASSRGARRSGAPQAKLPPTGGFSQPGRADGGMGPTNRRPAGRTVQVPS